FTVEEALRMMDEGGVDAAVIHPPDWDPNSTELAFKAARDFPSRFRDPRRLPAESARQAGPRRYVAEPARHARPALCVSSGADAGLAGRWHARLVMGRRRARRRADRHAGDGLAVPHRSDR